MSRVYLDPTDNAAAVRARVRAAEQREGPVELIVPYGHRVLGTAVGMLQLRRAVDDDQTPLYIVTTDRHIRSLARRQAIAAGGKLLDGTPLMRLLQNGSAGTSTGYDRYHYELRAQGRALRDAVVRTLAWAAALLLPPLAAVWFIWPSATITVRVPAEPIDQTLRVTVSSFTNTVEATNGVVPGKVVEVPVEVSVNAPSTGVAADPDKTAKGIVRFSNRSDQPVRVPAGTRVATASNVAFVTLAEASVPPARPSGIDVAVVAERQGTAGNIKPKEIIKVADDQLARQLLVENEAGFSGGAEGPDKVVTEADYQRLRLQALEQARTKAQETVEAQIAGDAAVAPGSLRVRVTGEELDPRIGAAAESLSLKLKGIARALVFNGEDLRIVVRKRMGATSDAADMSSTKLNVAIGASLAADNDNATFDARIQGAIGHYLDENKLKQLIAGKTPGEARIALLTQAPGSAPQIRLTAFWADRLPSIPWRITILQITGS